MRTVAELAGDVLCVGLPASDLDVPTARALADLRPGAIVLFARNVTTHDATRALVDAACDAIGDGVRPLVCVDQEGGRVARVRCGDAGVPAMLALGATDDVALAERVGARLAYECASVGATVDFAPVLDLALAPESTVIGTRSLGDDPARVAALGAAIVRGFARGGVASVVKHFPGHGGTPLDSHVTLPTIATSRAELFERDLVPFAAAFAAGARAVMTAHAIVTALDAERPATLSPNVLTTLLRDELGFAGVCFTDCLQMDAIARGVGSARGAVLALAAGADCCTISHDLDVARAARDAIVAAVADGSLSRARLKEAGGRVAALRRACADARATDDAAADVAARVAAGAIVRVRGDLALDAARPVTVVSFEGVAADGIAGGDVAETRQTEGRPSLSLALRRRRFRSESMRVPLDPAGDVAAMLLEVLAEQGDRDIVAIARRAHLYAGQRALLAALVATGRVVAAASALEPFDVPLLAGARAVACTFDDGQAAIDALADVLAGRVEARGRMPVALAASPA